MIGKIKNRKKAKSKWGLFKKKYDTDKKKHTKKDTSKMSEE